MPAHEVGKVEPETDVDRRLERLSETQEIITALAPPGALFRTRQIAVDDLALQDGARFDDFGKRQQLRRATRAVVFVGRPRASS